MSDDDHFPHPQPPRGAIPIGPAQGRQRGVVSEDEPTRPPPPPTRTQRAQETRPPRAARPEAEPENFEEYPARQDRHFVGEHPFDAALAELYHQRDQIDIGIQVLEKMKGQTP